MGRRSSGGVKAKKRKKVLVTPAVKMKDGALTEPYQILTDLIEQHREDLYEAEIAILWRSGWRSDPDGWTQMVNVKKAGDVDRALAVKTDFAVMLNKELFPRLPTRMKEIYLHHAIEHMRPMMDSDGEQKRDDKDKLIWRVKKRHDVEQFQSIIEIYGADSMDLDKAAIDAIKAADQPLLKDAPPAAAEPSGTKAATATAPSPSPTAWREWPISVLGEYGLPKAKVNLLEAAFDDRMGKLMDSLGKMDQAGFWWKDVKGLGEAGYDAMTEAIAKLRKDEKSFQVDPKPAAGATGASAAGW